MSNVKRLGMVPAGNVPNTSQASIDTSSNGAMLPLLLTIPAVAAKLGVSRPTVYEMIYHQGLPYIKLGRCMRISVASLACWLQEQEQSA